MAKGNGSCQRQMHQTKKNINKLIVPAKERQNVLVDSVLKIVFVSAACRPKTVAAKTTRQNQLIFMHLKACARHLDQQSHDAKTNRTDYHPK